MIFGSWFFSRTIWDIRHFVVCSALFMQFIFKKTQRSEKREIGMFFLLFSLNLIDFSAWIQRFFFSTRSLISSSSYTSYWFRLMNFLRFPINVVCLLSMISDQIHRLRLILSFSFTHIRSISPQVLHLLHSAQTYCCVYSLCRIFKIIWS